MILLLLSILVPCSWQAPAYGQPPEYYTKAETYVVQHSENGGPWNIVGTTADTFLVVDISYEGDHVVRVAAVDAAGRQGQWSLPSDTYTPSLPGEPGKPWRIE